MWILEGFSSFVFTLLWLCKGYSQLSHIVNCEICSVFCVWITNSRPNSLPEAFFFLTRIFSQYFQVHQRICQFLLCLGDIPSETICLSTQVSSSCALDLSHWFHPRISLHHSMEFPLLLFYVDSLYAKLHTFFSLLPVLDRVHLPVYFPEEGYIQGHFLRSCKSDSSMLFTFK